MHAFSCFIKGMEEYPRTIWAETHSKARNLYYSGAQDWHPDLDYKDVRCRKIKGAEIEAKCFSPTSEAFKRVANSRGVPFARCGQRVKVGGVLGLIVGHNDSANFDVVFLEGPRKGLTGNCHPGWEMMICVEDEFLDLDFFDGYN